MNSTFYWPITSHLPMQLKSFKCILTWCKSIISTSGVAGYRIQIEAALVLVLVLPSMCQTKIQLFIMYSLLYGLSFALCLCQLPLVWPSLSVSGRDIHIFALRSWMFLTSGPHQPAQWSLFTHTIPLLLTRRNIIIATHSWSNFHTCILLKKTGSFCHLHDLHQPIA